MITRFAPSPTGPLHLGHAYSAILAHDLARAEGGTFLLRIDDIDVARCRKEWEAGIFDDLAWLGLRWDGPVWHQSEQTPLYQRTLAMLEGRGLLYPCSCSRKDIEAAASAPQEGGAPEFGPDGRVYPGTCRGRSMKDRRPDDATRLNLEVAMTAELPGFTEVGDAHAGEHRVTRDYLMNRVGDPVVVRRGMAASYHLSVVVDDAHQNVSHVVRGEDLFTATFLQRFVQWILGISPPTYLHHRLIRDEAGKRLAKRDDARAIARYRADGATPEDLRRMVGL